MCFLIFILLSTLGQELKQNKVKFADKKQGETESTLAQEIINQNSPNCQLFFVQQNESYQFNPDNFVIISNKTEIDLKQLDSQSGFLEIESRQNYFQKNQKVKQIFQFTIKEKLYICFIIEELAINENYDYKVDCTKNLSSHIQSERYIFNSENRSYFQFSIQGAQICNQFELYSLNYLYFLCQNQSHFTLYKIEILLSNQNVIFQEVHSQIIQNQQQQCKIKYFLSTKKLYFTFYACKQWSFIMISEDLSSTNLDSIIKNELNASQNIYLENVCAFTDYIQVLFIFEDLYVQYFLETNTFRVVDQNQLIQYLKIPDNYYYYGDFSLLYVENKVQYFKQRVKTLINSGKLKFCKQALDFKQLNHYISLIRCPESVVSILFGNLTYEDRFKFEIIEQLNIPFSSYFLAINNTELFLIKYNIMKNQFINYQDLKNSKYLLVFQYLQYLLSTQLEKCLQIIVNDGQERIFVTKEIQKEQIYNIQQKNVPLELEKKIFSSNQLFEIKTKLFDCEVQLGDTQIHSEKVLQKLHVVLQQNQYQEYSLFPNYKGFIFSSQSINQKNIFNFLFFQGHNYSLIIYDCLQNRLFQYFINIEVNQNTTLAISQNTNYLILDRSQRIIYKLELQYDSNYKLSQQIVFEKRVKLFNLVNSREALICFNNQKEGAIFDFSNQINKSLNNVPEIDCTKTIRIIKTSYAIKVIQTTNQILILSTKSLLQHKGTLKSQDYKSQFHLLSVFSEKLNQIIIGFSISLLSLDNKEILIYYVTNFGYQLRTSIVIHSYTIIFPLYYQSYEQYLALLVQDKFKTKYFILLYDLENSRAEALKDVIEIANPYFRISRYKILYLNYENQFIEYDIQQYTFNISNLPLKNITNSITLNFSIFQREFNIQQKQLLGSILGNYSLIYNLKELIIFSNHTRIYFQKSHPINFHDYICGNIKSITPIQPKLLKVYHPFSTETILKCYKNIGHFCIEKEFIIINEIQINYELGETNNIIGILLQNENSILIIIRLVRENTVQIEKFFHFQRQLTPLETLTFEGEIQNDPIQLFSFSHQKGQQMQLLIKIQSKNQKLQILYFCFGQVIQLNIDSFHEIYFNDNISQLNALVKVITNNLEFCLFRIQNNQIHSLSVINFSNKIFDYQNIFPIEISQDSQIKILDLMYNGQEGQISFLILNNNISMSVLKMNFDLTNGKKEIKQKYFFKMPNEASDFRIAFVNEQFVIIQNTSFYVYQLRENQQEVFYCYSQELNSSIKQINETHFYWHQFNFETQKNELHFVNPQSYQLELNENINNDNVPLMLKIQNQVSEVTLHLDLIIKNREIKSETQILIAITFIIFIMAFLGFCIRRFIFKTKYAKGKLKFDQKI